MESDVDVEWLLSEIDVDVISSFLVFFSYSGAVSVGCCCCCCVVVGGGGCAVAVVDILPPSVRLGRINYHSNMITWWAAKLVTGNAG